MEVIRKHAGLLVVVSLIVFCDVTQAMTEDKDCVEGGYYNVTGQQCECDQGYKGLGDVCCEDTDEWSTCHVSDGSWMTSYDGTEAFISFPCISRLAVVTGSTKAGVACTVGVLSSPTVVQYGAIHPYTAIVTFSMAGQGRLFKLEHDSLQRSGESEPTPARLLYTKNMKKTIVGGETITVDYSFKCRVWTITGCGTKVSFRPAQNNNAVQDSRPGLCISTKKVVKTSSDVCSRVSSIHHEDQPLPHRVLNWMIRDIPHINSLDDHYKDVYPEEYSPVCRDVNHVVNSKCGGAIHKDIVAACAGLLYNGIIRMCFMESKVKFSGPALVSLFARCVEYRCSGAHTDCSTTFHENPALRTCYPSFCDF